MPTLPGIMHRLLPAVVLACLPAACLAQVAAPTPQADDAGVRKAAVFTHGQLKMVALMRGECVRHFPADASRIDAAISAYRAQDQRVISVAERYWLGLAARSPDGADVYENSLANAIRKWVPATLVDDAARSTAHRACEDYFGALVEVQARRQNNPDRVLLRSAPACENGEHQVPFCVDTSLLADARRAFHTATGPSATGGDDLPTPPAGVFDRVQYPSPAGRLAAWRTTPTKDGRRHPAIVWITGGDSNTLDEVWKPRPRDNDQTAAAYRLAGIVTMFPSLRGGNRNPGRHEGWYGEVDDILAAADWLAAQPDVDPERIYLGGHSTGGTLVLLTAEVSARFRAVFAFGPVANPMMYGQDLAPLLPAKADPREVTLRSPALWLAQVRSDTFVIEGEDSPGNIGELNVMRALSSNPKTHFLGVRGATHFSVLAPANALIARRILADGPDSAGVALDEAALAAAVAAR